MQDQRTSLRYYFYEKYLNTIEGIKFSQDKIDIMACLMHGKDAKSTAQLLPIQSKTVHNNLSWINKKLNCGSKQGIVTLIERSPHCKAFREYYELLQLENSFNQLLKRIHVHIQKERLFYLISHNSKREDENFFIKLLNKHLSLLGIKTKIFPNKSSHHSKVAKNQDINKILQIISRKTLIDSLSNHKEADLSTTHLLQLQKAVQSPEETFFVFIRNPAEGNGTLETSSSDNICLGLYKNYYPSFLDLLEKLLPTNDLQRFKIEFCSQHRLLTPKPLDFDNTVYTKSFCKKYRQFNFLLKLLPKKKKWIILGSLLFLVTLSVLTFLFKYNEGSDLKKLRPVIQSGLVIPSESTLLYRPKFLARLNEHFKIQNGIQSIALVGIGGAGKTILARQYALQQCAPVVWEVNSEKKGQLLDSFEKLAYAISSLGADKEKLKNILDIKNSSIKEQEVLFFIKEKLRAMPGWILIYDNVENFRDIQSHFPFDSNTWGTGKVILTTRDSNIQRNSHIKHIIQIGELDLTDKRSLFMKIINSGNDFKLLDDQQKEVKKLLEGIPPFPLDVSIAAYYLKMSNISYDRYREYLHSYNKDFENVQGSILNETCNYTKTRYEIITLSIKRLLDLDKDFIDLLLFISLLDSQNIPRSLLDKFKNNFIVDKFIFHLNKYSLIATDSSPSSNTSFSMHRSTQEIILAHLLNPPYLVNNRQLINSIVKSLEDYSMEVVAQNDIEKMKLFSKHSEAFLNHEQLLTEREKITIGGELIHINFWLSKDGKTFIDFIESLILKLKTNNFQNDPLFARMLSYLGICYWSEGNHKKAQNFLEQGIRVYTNDCGTDYVQLAKALLFLSIVYTDQGHLEKALKLVNKSITIYKNQNYQNRMEMAFALTRLGNVQQKLGRCQIAEDALLKSLSIYRNNGAKDHPQAGWALIILSLGYTTMEEFEKAKFYCEQGFIIYKKHYPENSLFMGWALRHLGVAYREVKNFEDAQKLLRQSLEIFKRTLGDNNIKTYWILFEIGDTYKRVGNTREAKAIYNKCLKKYKEYLGKNNLFVGKCLAELGEITLAEDNFEPATLYLHEAYKIYNENKFIEVYKVLENLAKLYLKKSKTEEDKKEYNQSQFYKTQAVSYLKEALGMVNKSFPANSRPYVRISAQLRALDLIE